jgi:hypothetical protein
MNLFRSPSQRSVKHSSENGQVMRVHGKLTSNLSVGVES